MHMDPSSLDRIWNDVHHHDNADDDLDEQAHLAHPSKDVISPPEQSSSAFVALFTTLVIIGGVGCNIAFETLSKEDPGCASVTSLFQYILTIAEGLPKVRQLLQKRNIPLYWHVLFVFLMFVTAYAGNKSVEWHVPFPLYLIIKSSNLVANVLCGWLILGKRYRLPQILAMVVLTVGVFIATIASRPKNLANESGDDDQLDSIMIIGVLLCTLSTFTMAALGNLQELVFSRYGKHYDEVLFLMHLLGLPLFAFDLANIRGHLHTWVSPQLSTWHIWMPFIETLRVPKIWALLMMNIMCCHLCKHSFFALLGSTSSLTATLAITMYRFAGILLSSLYFNAPPYPPFEFFVGAILVVSGSIGYLFSPAVPNALVEKKKNS